MKVNKEIEIVKAEVGIYIKFKGNEAFITYTTLKEIVIHESKQKKIHITNDKILDMLLGVL